MFLESYGGLNASRRVTICKEENPWSYRTIPPLVLLFLFVFQSQCFVFCVQSGYSSLPIRSFSSLSGGYLDSYDLGTDNSQSYLLEVSLLLLNNHRQFSAVDLFDFGHFSG
jgi:hypothetical protein